MLTSFNSLKYYVDIDVTPKELCEKMVMAGFEVEEMIDTSKTMDNVVVAKILEVKPHENSDHLKICQLDIGGGNTTQIITGADNIFEGAVVPAALDNSLLPNGVKIKKGKLRGVLSCGMMCSGEELNLKEEDFKGAEVHGILILPENLVPGTDMREVLGLNDYIIDFKITPNRPDCNSLIGIAREAAAVLGKEIKIPKAVNLKRGKEIDKYITVENKNYELCPRYMGAVVKNIRVKESPEWLKKVLKASGMRPINNIVDITNFVMLETGQPMHAFDLRELEDNKIIVRNAAENEIITLLDDKQVKLSPEMLVIADGKKPSCLAGVMGGAESGIKDDTGAVFFECAKFKRDSIRKTAKAVGVRTESSSRYEKGVDIINVEYALSRALQLIIDLDAGDVVEGFVDLNKGLPHHRKLTVSVKKVNALLGLNISGDIMAEILNKLSIKTVLLGDLLMCDIPSFRDDIEFTADIAEEVMRLYGYDHIVGTQLTMPNSMGGMSRKLQNERNIKVLFNALGLYEIYTYSFIAKGDTEKLGLSADNAITILNPLGQEYSVMRTQLVSSMLSVMVENINRGNTDGAFYEVSKRFIPKSLPITEQPYELATVSLGMYGKDKDFFKLKGIIEELFDMLEIKNVEYTSENIPPYLHPGRGAVAKYKDEIIAVFGEVHPKTAEKYECTKRLYVAEIYLDKLEKEQKPVTIFKPLPKFPAVARDLALICGRNTPVGILAAAIRKGGGKLLESLSLFDIYTGEQIEKDKKSVAYNITLRSMDHTLSEEETDTVINKILEELKKAGANLRQ